MRQCRFESGTGKSLLMRVSGLSISRDGVYNISRYKCMITRIKVMSFGSVFVFDFAMS